MIELGGGVGKLDKQIEALAKTVTVIEGSSTFTNPDIVCNPELPEWSAPDSDTVRTLELPDLSVARKQHCPQPRTASYVGGTK